MATKKIIYFTAGSAVTSDENADIAALNALAAPAYSVQVANASVPPNLGKTPTEEGGDVVRLMDCDFVAGTIPDDYDDIAVIDPDAPPLPDVGDDHAVIADDQVLTIGAETFTFTVVDGEITAIAVGEA